MIIPHHVAIIMDGNRRWAKKRLLPTVAGHWAGASTLKRIVQDAKDLGVKVLTVYSFSTENWLRPKLEIDALFQVLETYLIQEREKMREDGIALGTIGDLTVLPKPIQKLIEETKEITAQNKQFELVLALNYGSRDEIRRAIIQLIDDCNKNKITKEAINEELVSSYLDTSSWKDPDLLIRTSGEMRLSNFLLWQISYAEVYVTDILWPDFSKEHLLAAIKEYQKREKRRGV